MEIVHIILGKANPNRMNGVNKVVNEMATNQVKEGCAVQVWGITRNPVHDYPERNFETKLYKRPAFPFGANKKMLADLLEKKNDIVVHFHGAFIPFYFVITGFLNKHKIPFIITPHSTYNIVMMKKNEVFKKIYFFFFERLVLNRASSVHLLGKTEWEGLEAIYHNRKSVIIPYGFSKHPFDTNSGKKNRRFTVGYCGRISVYSKGLDILLEGFARFHKDHPESELLIIGEGKELPTLENMARELNIREVTHFAGSHFGEEKVELLNSCHVFAHPSRSDGLPATIVEAASLGLPCVVSEATNIGDYITKYKAGWMMPELDPQSFAEGLREMYRKIIIEQQERFLVANSLKMIDEVFDWPSILVQFNRIYEYAFLLTRIGQKEQVRSVENITLIS